jgi:uncharacterized protein (DUF2062 family)
LALRDRLSLILSVKDTPHRISMAFAVGIFIGMSPLFGIHTVLGIAVAYLFGLNRLVTIAGVYITNPWTVIPIYTFSTWLGAKCLHMNHILPDIDWKHITFAMLLNDFSPLVMPFIVGTVIMAIVSSVLSYVLVYRLTRRKNA